MEKITVFDPKKNKPVLAGTINGNTFIKKVTNKHYMIKLRSYGMSSLVTAILTKRGITEVLIKAKKHKYSSKLSEWLEHGFLRDYGHGKQYFLPVDLMREEKK